MEIYMSIAKLAGHLELAEQTIRQWVLKREIPFYKIKKVIRFRPSEIEKWIENGGMKAAMEKQEDEGDLFAGTEVEDSKSASGGTE